ncbi:MAG: dihydrolipoyl dehydrogenase [Candidatus Hydrogenedentota bacterium]
MKRVTHDLVVIGAGPGGYVAAIRGAQLGLDTACIEKESALGGTCLRVGCIPSKALLESSEKYWQAGNELQDHGIKVGKVALDLKAMLQRKDTIVDSLTKGVAGLFKKNKVTRYAGTGSFAAPGVVAVSGAEPVEIEAKYIIIATGSVSAPLKGVEVDGKNIVTSTEALAFEKVPDHLVVIGAGYIGLEMGSVWNRLGAKVTVLEYLDRILPGMDAEMATEAKKVFEKQGITFRVGCKVTGASVKGNAVTVDVDGSDPVVCDKVLLCVGRIPNTEGLNLQAAHIKTDHRGRIPVSEHFETTSGGVYAIGDVIAGPMLAHKAEEEGIACVEGIVKGHCHVNYDAIPGIVYTHPEIASVGKTEEQLKDAGIEYRKGVFPFIANGRAKALGETGGRVKMLADAKTDRILGVHILGPHAGDLIAECAVAIEFGASSEDLARSSHAHPTLAECVKEAALAVDGRAIHF